MRRLQRDEKIGVFVAGGPAAGINGVTKGVVQASESHGRRVVGYLHGAHGLVHDRFVHLSRDMIGDIDLLGGTILGTSRFNLESVPDGLERIARNLRDERVGALISIGGEGTLQLANRLLETGTPVAHVPKTIDNDIAGIPQSFGYDTAVHEATRLLAAVKLDAEATQAWFVVEIMGRYTGHLALEAGLAAGATRVLIPEEGTINLEELATLVETRQQMGASWGVVLVAESANFGQGYVTRGERLGGIAGLLSERLAAELERRRVKARVRTSDLGYFLRCAEPTGFDRSYAVKLGMSAVDFVLDPARAGHMVYVDDDEVRALPIREFAGKPKPVDLSGVRYHCLKTAERYESARQEVLMQRRMRRQAEGCLAWLDAHASPETIRELAMRLSVPESDLLAALNDLRRSAPVSEQRASKEGAT